MFDDIFSNLSDYLSLDYLNVDDPVALEIEAENNWEQDALWKETYSYQEISDFAGTTDWYRAECPWNASEFNGIGDPIQDAQFWQEQTSDTSCAVVAQISVFESITGVDLNEAEVCKIAEANGWYDPKTGTNPDAVGKILNALGVPSEQHYDGTLLEVANALERGDKVIVGLDANEIWTPLRNPQTNLPIEQSNAGHAVWVTGINQQADGTVKIILNDSGTPNGQMKAVDAEDFLNAWSDFGNLLVVAHAPRQQVIV